MTESEAIKIFNDLLDVPCEMLIKYDSVINSEKKQELVRLRTAEEIAINALEKQIPKKPKEKDCIGFNTLACPECKMALYLYEPYCDNCGQAIDWS